MSSTAPWKATPRSASPTWRTSRREEVVTWRTKKSMSSSSAPARRARSMPSVLAKAGKKVVVLERGRTGSSPISSARISGDAGSSRPARRSCSKARIRYGYAYQAGWGVGGAALHYFANFPRLLPNDFKIKSEHGRGARLADLLRRRRAVLRQGRARHRRVRRRQGRGDLAAGGRALSDAADEDLPQRRDLVEGLRGRRHPAGAGRRSA